MNKKEKLYISQEDLYRFGSGTSPQMNKIRPGEIDTYPVNGITMVRASDEGLSLYNKEGLEVAPLSGWVWEIKAEATFPVGLS